jgi:hypothetical protein
LDLFTSFGEWREIDRFWRKKRAITNNEKGDKLEGIANEGIMKRGNLTILSPNWLRFLAPQQKIDFEV